MIAGKKLKKLRKKKASRVSSLFERNSNSQRISVDKREERRDWLNAQPTQVEDQLRRRVICARINRDPVLTSFIVFF